MSVRLLHFALGLFRASETSQNPNSTSEIHTFELDGTFHPTVLTVDGPPPVDSKSSAKGEIEAVAARPIGLLLLDLLLIAALPELVDAGEVDLVGPGLVEVDEEDDVVAEGGEAVQDGHLDREGEQVVDEGVEELVRHRLRRHVRDGFQATKLYAAYANRSGTAPIPMATT
ncbi:hypothetical protein KC356_g264 [Hortaea werneckii]|nr:hypothetical protein KC356_g264 [Hortaea werneckii]